VTGSRSKAPEAEGRLALPDEELERMELQLLVEAVYRRYGFDFRDYARASLRRRVWNAVLAEGLRSISGLQERVLHEPPAMERLLGHLSTSATSMFRDPQFFAALREKVVPHLRSYPFVRIWLPGCGGGEEVYSLAILLFEEGLYARCRIYATDVNEAALKRGKEGIYPIDLVRDHAAGYGESGGCGSLSDYYTVNYGYAIFRQALRRNVLFSQHNLVTDGSFNEFNLILCRNVMIYFNMPLVHRVHRLLFSSLRRFGVLGLGRRESLRATPHEEQYQTIDAEAKLFRRPE
jgi:chemotaxis protein methyltransferase CheR